MKYYIYKQIRDIIQKGEKPKRVVERVYFRGKQKTHEKLIYVGEADLTDEFFIVGSETQFTDIVDLNDVEVQYTASLKNGRLATFKHSFQEMLERAKDGIMPYISFAEYKVNEKATKLLIKGELHSLEKPVKMIYENEI
jgi:hypothetical protein